MYKKTSQPGNADGLSRLPLTEPDEEEQSDVCRPLSKTVRFNVLKVQKGKRLVLSSFRSSELMVGALGGAECEKNSNKCFSEVCTLS